MGKQKTRAWLNILDESLIGPKTAYLCGDPMPRVDSMGAEMIAVGEGIGCTFPAYPNIERWLRTMKALES